MLTASLAVLCSLLVLVLLIQRPTAWLALLALVVLWGVVVVLFRCQLRKWVARWMCGGSFESRQPARLLQADYTCEKCGAALSRRNHFLSILNAFSDNSI